MRKNLKSFMAVFMALLFAAGYLLPCKSFISASASTAPTVSDGIYHIATVDDLLWAASNPENNFILTQDIDISQQTDWTPIGTEAKPFSGVFNGAGHTITVGINQTKSANGIYTVGLFGYLSGTVANLTVNGTVDAKIYSGYVGSIVANIAGGMIINCVNNAAITAEGTVGITHVGGIGGAVRSGFNVATVKNCTNNGNITIKALNLGKGSGDLGDGTSGAVGGILGFTCTGAAANITNSINNGNIIINGGSNNVGGIVGMTSSNNDNSKANITYCANKGNITINNIIGERAAGIIGYIKSGVIDFCYNIGNIIAYSDNGTTVSRVGYGTYYGIFGYANLGVKNSLEVKHCYNASGSPLEAEICIVRNAANGTFQNFYMQGRTEYETELGGATAGTAGTAFASAADLLTKITATTDGAKAYTANPTSGGYPVLYYEAATTLSNENYVGDVKAEDLGNYLHNIYFVLQTGSSINTQEITVTADILKESNIVKTVELTKGNSFKAAELTYKAAAGCSLFYGKAYSLGANSWTQAKITVKKGTQVVYSKILDNSDLHESVQIPFNSFPEYPDGEISTIYNAGPGTAVDQTSVTPEDSKMVVISKTLLSTFDTYIQTLLTKGFTQITKNETEQNIYYLLEKDNKYYYLYYTAYSNTVRIIEDNSTRTLLSKLDTNPTGTGKTEFYLYSIDYTHGEGQTSKTDYWTLDCGALLIIKLADNSLFIVDGGHERQSSKTAQEALLKFMYNVTGQEYGSQIKIRGWFFSHAHGDHVYAGHAFVESYHQYLNVESLLFNIPSYQTMSGGYDPYTFLMKQTMNKYYPDCKYVKLHTGQQFTLQGVKFDVLYTHEDAVNNAGATTISDFNDTSTILKVTMDGKSFMLLGDGGSKCQDTMLKMYTAATLHSDCVQVAHHGYNDLASLYNAIGAPLALFCNSETNSGANSGNRNKYLGVINAASNVVPLFADPDTRKITVENGNFVTSTIPGYRSAFTTLTVPSLSENLLTGSNGFKEDTNYVDNNKTLLLDKVIDKSIRGTAGNNNESCSLILDGKTTTKFCTTVVPATVVWTMKEAVTVNSYMIYTASDAAASTKRNPKKWVFCGSNDGQKWTVLDSVSSANLPDINSKGFAFKVSNPGSYLYYSIKFFATEGSTIFQVSELGIYSGVTGELQSVIDKINNLPVTITLNDESTVAGIRDTYNKMSAQQKALVTNYSALKAAEDRITALKTVRVSSVKITGTKTPIAIGSTSQLKATVSPSNATNNKVTWSTLNPKIATVDANGKVTAVSPGVATIKAQTSENNVYSTFKIYVKGWYQSASKWYFNDDNGKVTNKWIKDKNKWYYV
ncbi:MAG: Ig domain protein group 2 domain protein, partial [Oscillospiraceae bacterium]|nr:Ig domain protein group 2 domain protein [Oscillospiraceae bacterium]